MSTSPDPRTKRPEFLLEIYKQMMVDINRHLVVVWQSIGVLLGSFAIMGLVEKRVLSLDFAASLFVMICAWSLGLLIDSSYWYNRNLCIIANIERLFLFSNDLKHVHYYFGAHRPDNRMIKTLKIQVGLASGVGVLVLVYHFIKQILPGFCTPWSSFEIVRGLPYMVATIASWLLLRFWRQRNSDYAEFVRNSPGIAVSTEGIMYGGGHGFKEGGKGT